MATLLSQLGGGMKRAPFVMPKAESAFSANAEIYYTTTGWRFPLAQMAKRHWPVAMPETAENVAAEFSISRADQEALTMRSRRRYGSPLHRADIVPISIPERKGEALSVANDKHPRNTSMRFHSA